MAKANPPQENASAPAIGTPEYYEALLQQLNQRGGDAEFWYLKDGRNKVRLLPEYGRTGIFFETVQRSWQGGTPRTKYIVKAYIWDDKNEPQMRALVLPKTVIQQITGLLAEGYDLFSEAGNAITILKTGTGLETSYNTMPSAKAVAIPQGVEPLNLSLKELKELREKRDLEQAENRPEGQSETSSNGSKPKGEDQADW